MNAPPTDLYAPMSETTGGPHHYPDAEVYPGIHLDVGGHLVRVDGRAVFLSLKEFRLLTLLMGAAGQVQSRRSLLDRIWGPGYPDANKTLDVHIARLRRKLARPGHRSPIRTIRGVGYIYDR